MTIFAQLTIAAQNGHAEAVRFLCEIGANVDNRQGGWVLNHFIFLSAISVLLTKFSFRWTPLAIALQEAETNKVALRAIFGSAVFFLGYDGCDVKKCDVCFSRRARLFSPVFFLFPGPSVPVAAVC